MNMAVDAETDLIEIMIEEIAMTEITTADHAPDLHVSCEKIPCEISEYLDAVKSVM